MSGPITAWERRCAMSAPLRLLDIDLRVAGRICFSAVQSIVVLDTVSSWLALLPRQHLQGGSDADG